ncbi:FtsW/RodA/SpoVE family cell cycle protein [Sulfurimonas sp. HSL1-2]|uniref:FtsW/RodA/SpoVE family cell cycle protein n=1 Tax=Thiomicrolovo zhangzhouensis TaxID=3131933 RepID=UPI0031F8BF77
MPDRTLFVTASTLIAISVVMIYSLSEYTVVLFDYTPMHFALRQMAFGLFSILLMWAIAQLDPDVWLGRLGFLLFLGGLVLMLGMPFMPSSLVTEVGGAKRWIRFAGVSLAPVELFKIGFVYFLAWSFSRKIRHHSELGIKGEFRQFIPYAAFFILVMVLIAVMQKDLGQVMVLAMSLLFMLMLAGSSFRFFLVLMALAVGAFVVFIFTAQHRVARIISWWSLAQDSILSLMPEFIASHLRVQSHDEPYQISHSLNAIHNGGIIGTGLGSGTFKLGFLSEVHTDFILAGIAEEFGFIGVAVVTGLFAWMLKRIFTIANRTGNARYSLFSVGVGLLLAFAFLLNAFGISGITPIKGISVPFLSYGGSAMIASAVGVGMVLMISKKAQY